MNIVGQILNMKACEARSGPNESDSFQYVSMEYIGTVVKKAFAYIYQERNETLSF